MSPYSLIYIVYLIHVTLFNYYLSVDVGFTRPLDYFNCERMGGCGRGTLRTPYNVCDEFNASLAPQRRR
jgi:hypothetical protein